MGVRVLCCRKNRVCRSDTIGLLVEKKGGAGRGLTVIRHASLTDMATSSDDMWKASLAERISRFCARKKYSTETPSAILSVHRGHAVSTQHLHPIADGARKAQS